MKRINLLSIISFFLMVLIMAPTVVRLLAGEDDSLVVLEINDEENQKENKKKGEAEKEEKNKICYNLDFTSKTLKEENKISTWYSITRYDFSREIVSPPPETNI